MCWDPECECGLKWADAVSAVQAHSAGNLG